MSGSWGKVDVGTHPIAEVFLSKRDIAIEYAIEAGFHQSHWWWWFSTYLKPLKDSPYTITVGGRVEHAH